MERFNGSTDIIKPKVLTALTNAPVASLEVLHTSFNIKLPDLTFTKCIDLIPDEMRRSVRKFLHWEDAQRCLLGKLLLIKACQRAGYDSSLLHKIQYTEYNRPFFDAFNFNISHAGNKVVCVWSKKYTVGIDVEKIKPIPIDDFTSQFTVTELNAIKKSRNALASFYEAWTKKEAIVKADGKGMSIPLHSIEFMNPLLAKVGEQQWQLFEIKIEENYPCHVAADCPEETQIGLVQYDFYNEY